MRIIAADHEPSPLADTSACDAIEAHVDPGHEASECGWLTLDEQRQQGWNQRMDDCGHPIGYCTNACDDLPAGFNEEDYR